MRSADRDAWTSAWVGFFRLSPFGFYSAGDHPVIFPMDFLEALFDVVPHLLPCFRSESCSLRSDHRHRCVGGTNTDQLRFVASGKSCCRLQDRYNGTVDVYIYKNGFVAHLRVLPQEFSCAGTIRDKARIALTLINPMQAMLTVRWREASRRPKSMCPGFRRQSPPRPQACRLRRDGQKHR